MLETKISTNRYKFIVKSEIKKLFHGCNIWKRSDSIATKVTQKLTNKSGLPFIMTCGEARVSTIRRGFQFCHPSLSPLPTFFAYSSQIFSTVFFYRIFLLTQKLPLPLKTFIRTISSTPKVQLCRPP